MLGVFKCLLFSCRSLFFWLSVRCSSVCCIVCTNVRVSIHRGHTIAAVCRSFCNAKDAGFKIIAHMMPDLPNTGFDRDLQGFKVPHCCHNPYLQSVCHCSVCAFFLVALHFCHTFCLALRSLIQEFFANPAFRADGLKIYPTLVIRGTDMQLSSFGFLFFFCCLLYLCFLHSVLVVTFNFSFQSMFLCLGSIAWTVYIALCICLCICLSMCLLQVCMSYGAQVAIAITRR